MTLSSGTRLGPYEIVAPLGAGGMGEVYRARDPRLGREVAIKVLPASFSQDADRLKRFEQEARAAGVLNHPNITAVHDFGTHEGSPYIVTELLEGETLRSRLSSGALPVRKAIDYAVQMARGLAAAHEKGIVHRDLKPENVFVTRDGRVKILDFGLAKLKTEKDGEQQTDLRTVSGTEPGVVLGTMGYMSPEQVRGKPADRRSDLFSFGAILYEMLSGQRAFRGDTAADTITAILSKEPPDLTQTNQEVHPGLERIVRHCLEKNPEERFESARDVAFDLESLSGVSSPRATSVEVLPRMGRRPLLPLLSGAVLLLLVLGAVYLAGTKAGYVEPPSFRQLTFRRGTISFARFAPDGQTILYGSAWEGQPVEIFVSRSESPESRPFGLPGADILAISRSGEMALSLGRHIVGPFESTGTLARMGVAGGGAPRAVLENIEWADWSPDGKSLAVVRDVNGRNRLEFPIGKVLYETAGWITNPRVSPEGDLVAFLDHPVRGDDGGSLALVDRTGKKRNLPGVFETLIGLAWSPRGEIWFTGAKSGANRALYASSVSGKLRLLARVTGILTLQDVGRDGRVLMTHDTNRQEIFARGPGFEKERDLSWLDWSQAIDISPDGKALLFAESGEGGGPGYSIYLRSTDGSPAVRLGEGNGYGLSPDGKWAIAAVKFATDPQLVLYPTGAGEARFLPREGLRLQRAVWFPDGKRLAVTANEPGHGARIYVWDLAGGKPRALTPEGYRSFAQGVSPDGKLIAVRGPDEKVYLYPTSGGEPTAVPGATPEDTPSGWSADGRALYVYRRRELPAKVYLLDITTGRKQLFRELMPSDSAGVTGVAPPHFTPDGSFYAYSCLRTLSDLYLVEGLK
ncbi:MAG TPA: protein kinase [Thermoanaerobaculia bacterium]|nr:protein kinase [Thermoanaerobaculia bacterium]